MKRKKSAVFVLVIVLFWGLLNVLFRGPKRIDPVWDYDSMVGQSEMEITNQFGVPDSRHDFILSDGGGEIATPLFRMFPKKDWSSTQIRSLHWQYRDYDTIFYLHRTNGIWKVVDGVGFLKGVQF